MQFWAFYRVFRRWRWMITAICLFVPLVIGVASFLQPRSYVAKATFYTYQEAYQELSTSGTELEKGQRGAGDLLRLMRTRAFVELVKSQLDFELEYDAFVRRLSTSGGGKDSRIIDVSWTDTNDDRAAATLNTIVDAFGEFYREQQTAGFKRTREVLEKQLQERDAELQAAQDALLEFQRENNLVEGSDITTAKADYKALVDQRKAIQSSIRQAEVKASALGAQLAGTSELEEVSKKMRPNPDAELIRGSLMQNKAQLLTLQQKYQPDHPDILDLKDAIAGLEQTLAETEPFVEGETELAANSNRQEIEAQLTQAQVDLQGLQAQKSDLDTQIAASEEDLPQIPALNFEFEELTRVYTRAQTEAQQLSAAVSDAKVSEQAAEEEARIEIIDRATLPLEEVSRKTAMKVMAGFMASLFLSFTFVFLLEQIDNRIKGPADVERLMKLRSLAALPLLITREPDAQPTPEEVEEEQIRVASFREAVRSLRSQLLLLGQDSPARALGVLSARAGVGKTTVAANLAESLAQAGHRTLLIDADFRRPSVHSLYDLPNEIGLSDVLQGHSLADGALQATDVPGLHILAAGPLPDDPAMLLGAPSMRELVATMRPSFDWIIVDTPAALAHADSIVTAAALEAVLIVTAAGEIARGSEGRLIAEVDAIGRVVLGAVVNKVLPQHADSLYHYRRYQAASTARLKQAEEPAQAPDAESENASAPGSEA